MEVVVDDAKIYAMSLFDAARSMCVVLCNVHHMYLECCVALCVVFDIASHTFTYKILSN